MLVRGASAIVAMAVVAGVLDLGQSVFALGAITLTRRQNLVMQIADVLVEHAIRRTLIRHGRDDVVRKQGQFVEGIRIVVAGWRGCGLVCRDQLVLHDVHQRLGIGILARVQGAHGDDCEDDANEQADDQGDEMAHGLNSAGQ